MSEEAWWDQFAPDEDLRFVKFVEIGDTVRGEIMDLGTEKAFDKVEPKITFRCDDGTTREWTVTQKVAKRKLSEIRPQLGWVIEARYSGDGEARPGRAPAKLIEIEVISRGSDRNEQQVMSGTDL
jgi:hypothetical protein